MERKESASQPRSESHNSPEDLKSQSQRSDKLRLVVSLIVAGLIGYFIGVTKINVQWTGYQPHVDVASKEPPPAVSSMDFGRFWVVMQKIEDSYYNKTAVDSTKMLNGAISGMVSSLEDPYTLYLPPQQNTNFKQGLAGQFEGIGAELGQKGKDVIVVSPLDGGPAVKAGIKAGDTILKVNTQSIAGLDINQVVDKIRGPKGTPVTLTVLHKDEKNAVDIKIMRDTIQVKSLTSWVKQVKDIPNINKNAPEIASVKDQKVEYIRLSQFGDTTHDEWQQLATKTARDMQNDKSIKGIVFDLRNNPGGYLQDAVYIISEFVKSGVAVMQEDRNNVRQSYPVSGSGLLTEAPVIVLVNKGSASAAEITAGGLRDNGRAEIVGESSFGKGTIQEAEDLGGGAGLHVTIAKWLTPKGFWVGNGKNGTGLTPDVDVKLDPKDPTHDTQLERAVEELFK